MASIEHLQTILRITEPLSHPRGNRLPLFLWSALDIDTDDREAAEQIILSLNERGIALAASWDHRREDSLARALRIARIQQEHGLEVCVNVNTLLHRFCTGKEITAHIDEDGNRFFDTSYQANIPLGCPFALASRYPDIKRRFEPFAQAYAKESIPIFFAFADWEIDGVMEWNESWSLSKRCIRCRKNIPEIENFHSFQSAIREIRAEMQRVTFAEPLKARFPGILVSNYGVYPHNGIRYWYDYFEEIPSNVPHLKDGNARYRKWHHEFASTGYTAAMPVVYPWSRLFSFYDFPQTDYRWFYNMLLAAGNAGKHTPSGTPVIPSVHKNTIFERGESNPCIQGLSREKYLELLWHMLLRNTSTFFLWCRKEEIEDELPVVREVYSQSLLHSDILNSGKALLFDVPRESGPVISAVLHSGTLLLRRTDFYDTDETCAIEVEGRLIDVPRRDGECQIITL